MTPQEAIIAVCEALENGATSVRDACRQVDYPRSIILTYIDSQNLVADSVLTRYRKAVGMLMDRVVDETDEIATGAHRGEGHVDNNISISRDRLILQNKQWTMSKLMPNKLGDAKQEKEDTGPQQVVIVGGLPPREDLPSIPVPKEE